MPYFGDSFDDNTRHSNWTPVQAGGATMAETGGKATFSFPSGSPGSMTSAYYREAAASDYTGTVAQIELVQAGSGSAGGTMFELWRDDSTKYQFLIEGSAATPSLYLRGTDSGSTPIDQLVGRYSPTDHRFLRFRHVAGSGTMVWETSPDGAAWTTRLAAAVLPGAPASALRAGFGVHAWAYNDEPATAAFDNFNPAAATQVNGTGAPANTPPAVTIAQGTSGSVVVGQTLQLSVAVVDAEDNPDPGVVWASSNPAVATISASGLVSGVAAGSSTVLATATDAGGLSGSDSFALTVTAVPSSTTHQLRERRISDGALSPILTVQRPNN